MASPESEDRPDEKAKEKELPEWGDARFRPKKWIGGGAQGEVWLAYDTMTGTDVALKVICVDDEVSEEDARIQTQKVMKIPSRVEERIHRAQGEGKRHRNVVKMLDVRNIGDKLAIAMEFVAPGKSLKQTMDEGLSSSDILEISVQICSGLSAAHVAKIIHRDIKPTNILLAEDETVVIADWEVSNIMGGGTIAGSFDYMAGEVLRKIGDPDIAIDQTVDIFALGVIMYQACTRVKPFTSNRKRKLSNEIRDRLTDTAGEDLARIVLKAMADRPQDRYQTAGEMMCALETLRCPGIAALGLIPLDEACAALEKCLEKYPRSPLLNKLMGDLCCKKGDNHRADKCFRDALKLGLPAELVPGVTTRLKCIAKDLGR